MTERLENSLTPIAEIASTAPPGPVLDRVLPCPLCTYDLRGTTEPRCPECGYPFSWDEILKPEGSLHPYLFEHHPERNLWSFFKSLRGGLRPRRFWSQLHPQQPIRSRRLLVYFLLTSGLIPLMLVATSLGRTAVDCARQNRVHRTQLTARLASPNPPIGLMTLSVQYPSLNAMLDDFAPRPGTWKFVRQVFQTSLRQDFSVRSAMIALALMAWPPFTILALCIFRWSMRRARIRVGHVARSVVYSADFLLWLGLILIVAGPFFTMRFLAAALGALGLFAIGQFTYRLSQAYARYLRFDHPFWTVAASQAIVALFLLNVVSILVLLLSRK